MPILTYPACIWHPCWAVVLFCSLAVLDLKVGHTMDVLSLFIPVLCHSDSLFHGESCPRLDVVHPAQAFLAFVHLALFLALSLSPGNSCVSSWCYHNMLASLLSQMLKHREKHSSFVKSSLICFILLSTKPAESFSVLSSQRRLDVFLHSF